MPAADPSQPEPAAPLPETFTDCRLVVNGEPVAVRVDNRTSLLDLLRDHLGLTGAKKGCDHGQCGACTVLLDGRRANACLILAPAAGGRSVVTIEGLGAPDALHPVQQAFVDHDAFQCGYCTPGQICSAVGVLDELAAGWPSAVTPPEQPVGAVQPTAAEVRDRLSGNLCRCGAYVNIVPAVLEAAEGRR